jgi:hypothetical protein
MKLYVKRDRLAYIDFDVSFIPRCLMHPRSLAPTPRGV